MHFIVNVSLLYGTVFRYFALLLCEAPQKMFDYIKMVCMQKQSLHSYSALICPPRVSLWFLWITNFHGRISRPFLLPSLLGWLPRLFEPNQNVTKKRWGWQCHGAKDVEVCWCIVTCGRAWTTVSSRALIPVAIFNSFNTVKERKREREMWARTSYQSVCVCLWMAEPFRRRKTKSINRERRIRPPQTPAHLGLIPA